MFPFDFSSIDWSQIDKKIILPNDSEATIRKSLEILLRSSIDQSVYILWDDADLPVIKTDLTSAIHALACLTSLHNKTWFFNPAEGYVFEWLAFTNKTIGVISEEKKHEVGLWLKFLDQLTFCEVQDFNISNEIIRTLKNKFGYRQSIVDWDLITVKKSLDDPIDIYQSIKELLEVTPDEYILISWKNDRFPIVKANLKELISNWETFLSANPKWIIDVNFKYVLEIIDSDKILIGIKPLRFNKKN
jgi:hypothetical protein